MISVFFSTRLLDRVFAGPGKVSEPPLGVLFLKARAVVGGSLFGCWSAGFVETAV